MLKGGEMKGLRICVAVLFFCVCTFFVKHARAQEDISKLKDDLKSMQENMSMMQKKIEQLESEQAQVKQTAQQGTATKDEASKAMQQNMNMMQKRIEQLQAEQTKVQESVREELAAAVKEEPSKLSWHGYFSWNYQDDTNPGADPAFDAFALALIPKFTLSDKIEIYSQLVFEHAPFHDVTSSRTLDARSSGEIVLNDVYLTYTVNEWMKFRAGKFATPFGLWNTLQYAAPTYVTIKQPGRDSFYSRGSTTDTDANLYGRYAQGAWLLGEYDKFFYDFYVANGKTSLRAHLDDNKDKSFGGRLGVNLNIGESNLKLMYSRYQDRFYTQTDSRTSTSSAITTGAFYVNQYTNALSAEFNYEDLGIVSEIADSKKRGVSMNAFYILAKYNLGEKWVPFVQYQFYEPNRDALKDKTNYYTIGTAYQILPWQTMLKLQADYVKPEGSVAADYYRLMLGLAAAF
jgi:hypothetical protein